MDIKRVVIPAAGLGTRFLPYTKSIPKEMLPIINKPAIEYIVQEAIDSGITDFYIITSKTKKAISDYFSISSDFNNLIDKSKLTLLSGLDKIINDASFSYINQDKQLGLGHAILMAKDLIKDDYFGVMLPDDIIISHNNPCISQLIKLVQKLNGTVIAVQEVSSDLVGSYGIVGIEKEIDSNLFKVSDLIEKPEIKDAPSNLAIIGRYVLSSKIFDSLKMVKIDSRNEIQLTDAISHMLKNGENVYAYKIQGKRYDIGVPSGWLAANIEISKTI